MEATFHFTLALDPADQSVEMIGAETNLPGCEPILEPTEACYVKKFKLSPAVAQEMFDWFIQCGMTTKDANETIPEIKKSLKSLFKVAAGRDE